jgi:hypothetical protein
MDSQSRKVLEIIEPQTVLLGNAPANMGDIILTRISEKHQTYALFIGITSLSFRVLSEKGSSPTELGVIRPTTANVIGLLPIKKSPALLSESSLPRRETG